MKGAVSFPWVKVEQRKHHQYFVFIWQLQKRCEQIIAIQLKIVSVLFLLQLAPEEMAIAEMEIPLSIQWWCLSMASRTSGTVATPTMARC